MKYHFVFAALAAAMPLCVGQTAQAECKLGLLATIPITFVNERPMVEAKINGKPALLRFTLTSGVWIWGSALKEYDLKLDAPTRGEISAAKARTLEVSGSAVENAQINVALLVKREGEAGAFGTPLFNRVNDIELDFAHNAVRVFKPDGCKGDDVVYWGGNYGVADQKPNGLLSVKLSGKSVGAELAPGNEVTYVLPAEAQRQGVSLQRAGSLPADLLVDQPIKPVDISIGRFSELSVGDETMKNVALAVVGNPVSLPRAPAGPDVMLGADFARAHRIYFSPSQRKMYFSYGGGPAFRDIYATLGIQNLSAPPPKP